MATLRCTSLRRCYMLIHGRSLTTRLLLSVESQLCKLLILRIDVECMAEPTFLCLRIHLLDSLVVPADLHDCDLLGDPRLCITFASLLGHPFQLLAEGSDFLGMRIPNVLCDARHAAERLIQTTWVDEGRCRLFTVTGAVLRLHGQYFVPAGQEMIERADGAWIT